MSRNYRKWILGCMLYAVLLGGCGGASEKIAEAADAEENAGTEEKTKETAVKKAESGSVKKTDALPLPVVFEGQDMEGNTVSSEIFSDSKLTMINVWATYCSPCLNEMPELSELAAEYEKEDFQLVGIISDVVEGADEDTMDIAAQLIEKTGADYPHLLLNESLYNALLEDVTAVPTTFFFNEHGMLLDTVVGARDKDAWEEIVNGFLED